MKLRELQESFSHYLYDKSGDRLSLESEIKEAFTPRLEIYRNNLLFSVVDLLLEVYPNILKVLGEKNFKFFAREYLYEFPSKTSNLDDYGEDFSSFLNSRPELESYFYLENLAQLDWNWQIFHRGTLEIKLYKGVYELWLALSEENETGGIHLDLEKSEVVAIDPTGQNVKIFLKS